MARGKHGAAAAVRQEVQSRDTEIATYQNRVAKLTAENKKLREQLDAERQAARRKERELLTRIDHAASPKIEALELLVKRRTEQRDEWQRKWKRREDEFEGQMQRLMEHFSQEHGLVASARLEAAIGLLFPDLDGMMLIDAGDPIEKVPPNIGKLIQQKRGLR